MRGRLAVFCGQPLLGRRSLRGIGSLYRVRAVRSRCAMRGNSPLCSVRALRSRCTLRGRSALLRRRTISMPDERALQEALFCEQILAKGGTNILLETLRDAPSVEAWSHYPKGDVYDPDSGAQWYYHAHAPSFDGIEHGHFHCFLRPQGRDGPVHHLVAIGVDAHGRLHRLFTVNQWVVGDTWLEAEATVALLSRFDVQMPGPSYLVNRWLTAIVRRYEDEIAALVRQRDRVIDAHAGGAGPSREDRSLEVTSSLGVSLAP